MRIAYLLRIYVLRDKKGGGVGTRGKALLDCSVPSAVFYCRAIIQFIPHHFNHQGLNSHTEDYLSYLIVEIFARVCR